MKQVSYILLFAFLPIGLFAQESDSPQPEPYFTALIVGNIDTSLAWYTKNLGYELLNQVDLKERGLRMANLRSGEGWIELIEIKDAVSPQELQNDASKKTRFIGIFKFGFLVNDLDQWVKRLTDSGVEFSGNIVEDSNNGMRMIIIRDPDGNRVQLFEKKS